MLEITRSTIGDAVYAFGVNDLFNFMEILVL